MLLIGARAKGFGKVHIEEIVVPLPSTAHTMRISDDGEQILFYTMHTRLILAIWADQLFSQLYGEF